MKARNVVIVTSGQAKYCHAGILDEVIAAQVAAGRETVLVLGPDGDEFLRSCKRIDDCEIVFDPNYEGGFFSGVKAGLLAATGATFVLRLSELPPAHEWTALENSLSNLESLASHLLQPIVYGTARWDFTLVTLQGLSFLRKLAADSSWENNEQIITKAIEVSEVDAHQLLSKCA